MGQAVDTNAVSGAASGVVAGGDTPAVSLSTAVCCWPSPVGCDSGRTLLPGRGARSGRRLPMAAGRTYGRRSRCARA